MKLHFEFTDICLGANNKQPMIDIRLNDASLYAGPVIAEINCEANADEHNCLEILFTNKQQADTVCDSDNKIIKDMNFTLGKIKIDDLDIEELIWQSRYLAGEQEYPGCLFFGPRGRFVLLFSSPVLKWILSCRHQMTQQDPNWEEDYNYYITACKILNNL
jgi:hypothetical protein